MVNVDHLHVGWYQVWLPFLLKFGKTLIFKSEFVVLQSAHFGNFLSPQLLESHFAYQTSIEESVCLIFDTAKTSKGYLTLKAFRLTPMAIQLYKSGDFTAENIIENKVNHDNLFEEVPIIIKNSHLVSYFSVFNSITQF